MATILVRRRVSVRTTDPARFVAVHGTLQIACVADAAVEMENDMIMLITYRSELRDQLNAMLQARGYKTCIPPHRQDVVAVMEECHPELILLDMYLADPSGLDVLKTLRDERYEGPIVMLSGPSMKSVIRDALPMGVDKVVHVPAQIAGRFDFGELAFAIESTLKSEPPHDRKPYHSQIARRAHELYEQGGRQHGRDVHDWLRAEQELAS